MAIEIAHIHDDLCRVGLATRQWGGAAGTWRFFALRLWWVRLAACEVGEELDDPRTWRLDGLWRAAARQAREWV